MSLKYLGRQPDDIGEYQCEKCGTEFEFRACDWKSRKDYLEPKYCPICGVE